MSSIDLSSKNIKDSQNIFNSFKQPSKIVTLDLSNNFLTKLPENLSHLSNLEKLDLLNNPFEDYKSIGAALSTLPKLIDLKIDLTTQEHAFLILTQLPNLLLLNGKSTNDEDDDKNQIDLNDTETDKSSFTNEIPNFNSVTNRITQILNERNEKTDEYINEFQKILKDQIDSINSLDSNIPNYVYSSYIQQAKVEIYSYLQNKILNMINAKLDYVLINLLNEVNQYIKKILGETILIIRNIYPKCEEIEKNYKNEINQRDIKINELQKQIDYLNENKNNNLNNAKNNNNNNNSNSNNNVNSPINKNNYEISERNNKSPHEYNINNNDNDIFSISYNDEAKNILENLKSSNSNFNQNPKEEPKKINNNNSNNIQNMTFNNNKNIYNFSKINPGNNINNDKKNNLINKSNNNINSNFNSNKISAKKNPSDISLLKNDLNNNNNNNFLNEPSLSYQPSISNLSQYSNITNAPPKDLKTVIGPISKRDMTIRQLLETINDIYNSKLENDKKLSQNHQQKLTMEQFLYYYLNNKYGLKNLVIEYASCIIQGIKDFSKKNSEVLLFGKILRNEIEEQEILIIAKLKETINEFLTFYYQNKFQYKSKNEIDNMVKKCKIGILNEEQWKNIVGFLFSDNENDMNNLMNKIQKYIDRQNIIIENNQKYGNSISYQKFIQLVIDYQIKIRSIYLKNFNIIFKKVDIDRDGIISDYEFGKLVEISNIFNNKEEMENKTKMMIKELDKYSNGTIIYNDIINLWNKEMIYDEINGEKLSLLDKLSME